MNVDENGTKPLSELGGKWHNKIRGRFKKEGLVCEILDKNNRNKSVDFFVHKKNNKQEGFLCEIKSVISGGFDSDIRAHISSGDTRFLDAISVSDDNEENISKKYEFDYDHEHFMEKINKCLREALDQYSQSNNIDRNHKPFVLSLCFDFFAGFPGQVNFTQLLEKYPPISAIIMIERDFQRELIKKRHLKELNQYYKNRRKLPNLEDPSKNWELDYKGAQDTVDFKIYLNRKALITFKPDNFFRRYHRATE